MHTTLSSVITGTGRYIPEEIVPNDQFLSHSFFEKDGRRIERENEEIIRKFRDITEIEERRYAGKDQVASDLGYLAAVEALTSSGTDPETLDYIIVAHNFGDISYGKTVVDVLPTLAAKIKHKLGIANPDCVAYDIPFGCPGWLQGIIHADYFIRSGDAKKILVIGTETLSRVNDPHDRDSMIFSDGAAATILEAGSEPGRGFLAHKTQSHTKDEAYYLYSERSSNPEYTGSELFIKMDGRKIYEYALTNVPLVMKAALDKSGLSAKDVTKVLVHQANGKMDEAILKRFLKLCQIPEAPDKVMPMTISHLGNSSVATVPTLLDLILKNDLEGHQLNPGDVVIFASVGAGMNINAAVYRF
ncbi:MAG TPA: ketoacyl-ACP synthase III [Sphingobacteriaceae bacterium]